MKDLVPTSLSVVLPLGIAAFALVILAGLGKVPFSYNLRNLVVRWKTTFVTALAFTLVIALLVVMLAFVNGMNRLTEGSAQPGNIMILADGATDEVFSNLAPTFSVELLPENLRSYLSTTQRGDYLVSQEVYVIVNQVLKNPKIAGPSRRFVQMRGIRDPLIAARVHDLEILQGRWFSEGGVQEVTRVIGGQTQTFIAYEIVVGEGAAAILGKDLDKDRLEVGDLIDIGPHTWLVVGLMRSASSTFGSEIWARDTIVQQSFGRENSYSTFVAQVRDPALVRAAARALKEYKVGANVAFEAQVEKDYYARLQQTNVQFQYAISFVAMIMAIGGVLGVMNTMFAAISQRARDIGVLRLLGYSRGQVLISFLLESLVIALVGGLLGCAIGYLFDGTSATSIASSGQGGGKSVVLRLVVDGNILATALLVTLAMGFLGGLIPSLSAMRLKPLESLR